ncbi:MAG: hypothetical protein JW724_04850 [Candidatus Altiarchaeota archaeon]|nr:hypothetical protein [Candidatus Altiarchaeota archaeon]
MKPSNKGQASVIDVLMLSMIIVISLTFLQIYSLTHASSSTRDTVNRASDEYAINALNALSYVTVQDTSYTTIQTGTVSNVSDPDLQGFVNASLEVRDYARALDERLDNWSANVTEATEEIDSAIDGIIENITEYREILSEKNEQLTSGLEDLESSCTDLTEELNTYAQLAGGTEIISEDSCTYAGGLKEYIDDTASSADQVMADATNDLNEAKDALHTDAEKARELLQDARCLLRALEIKLDRFVTYAQTGVKEDSTLIDLLPVETNLETKTVEDLVTESLYMEDRLMQSDNIRAAAAAGVRIVLQETGTPLNDTKNQIAQATVLTLERKESRELAVSAVGSSLEKTLTGQGYKYCFTAETCCSTLTAGECSDIPDDHATAKRAFNTPGNETGEMTLKVWR